MIVFPIPPLPVTMSLQLEPANKVFVPGEKKKKKVKREMNSGTDKATALPNVVWRKEKREMNSGTDKATALLNVVWRLDGQNMTQCKGQGSFHVAA